MSIDLMAILRRAQALFDDGHAGAAKGELQFVLDRLERAPGTPNAEQLAARAGELLQEILVELGEAPPPAAGPVPDLAFAAETAAEPREQPETPLEEARWLYNTASVAGEARARGLCRDQTENPEARELEGHLWCRRAFRLQRREDPSRHAYDAVDRLAESLSDRWRHHKLVAHALLSAGLFKQAVGHIHDALERAPKDPELWFWAALSTAFGDLSHPFFRLALELMTPECRPALLLGVASLQAASGSGQEAQTYRLILEGEPECTAARAELGLLTGSAAELDRAIDEDPRSCTIRLQRADFRFARGDLAGALEDTRDLLALAPRWPRALHSLMRILERSPHAGTVAEQLACRAMLPPQAAWQQVITRTLVSDLLATGGVLPQVLAAVGARACAVGRVQDGVELLRAAIVADPELCDGHYNLGCAEFQAGDLQAAVPHFERCLDLSPHHMLALDNLGSALAALGDRERATSLLLTWLELAWGAAVDDQMRRVEFHLRSRPFLGEQLRLRHLENDRKRNQLRALAVRQLGR